MPKKKTYSKRVSKSQWLERALKVLQREGIQGVRIERLARDLGIAKAGFYWHFADRQELLRDMLHFWSHEYTEIVIGDPRTQTGSPRKRLCEIARLVTDRKLAKYDLAVRAWATTDAIAAKAARRVYRIRTNYVRSIFEELGLRGLELETRARMFVCYYSWSQTIFNDTRKDSERMIRHQINWFCQSPKK